MLVITGSVFDPISQERLFVLEKRFLAQRIGRNVWTVVPGEDFRPTHPLDKRWKPPTQPPTYPRDP